VKRNDWAKLGSRLHFNRKEMEMPMPKTGKSQLFGQL
jgi:hypothetical protein